MLTRKILSLNHRFILSFAPPTAYSKKVYKPNTARLPLQFYGVETKFKTRGKFLKFLKDTKADPLKLNLYNEDPRF